MFLILIDLESMEFKLGKWAALSRDLGVIWDTLYNMYNQRTSQETQVPTDYNQTEKFIHVSPIFFRDPQLKSGFPLEINDHKWIWSGYFGRGTS